MQKIGVVNAVQNVYPYSSSPEDVLAAMDAEEFNDVYAFRYVC